MRTFRASKSALARTPISALSASTAKPRFRSDIEGVRAIAILLVVLYHAGVPGFSGGYIGVDVFFVLSGYLITWLLVREAEKTGTIDFLNFYARRARRLLPAAALMLLVTNGVGMVVLAPFEQGPLASTATWTGAYLSNIHFVRKATDYLGGGMESNPLLHTWSLSVEEQFYVVWPLFVFLALGVWKGRLPNRRRLLGWMATAALVSFGASVWILRTNQPWAFFLSPLRAWEFAAGAMGVLLPPLGVPQRFQRLAQARTSRLNPFPVARLEQAMGWIGVAVILATAVLYTAETPFPGLRALPPVVATVLVLRAGTAQTRTALARLLSLRPFQEIGRLSYSWYLWHWPVLVYALILNEHLSLGARIALLLVSLGISELSYRLVEDPIRHNQTMAGRPAYALVMAAVITLISVGVSLSWHSWAKVLTQSPTQKQFALIRDDVPLVYDECHRTHRDTRPVACKRGDLSAQNQVVLFGDSHAAQWFPAVDSIVRQQNWGLRSHTKSACAPVAALRYDAYIKRDYHECSTWVENVVQEIEAQRPRLVIISQTKESPIAPDVWERGLTEVVKRLSAASGQAIVLRDTPTPGHDVPSCLARLAWSPDFIPHKGCTFAPQSHAAFELEQRVSNLFDNVHTVSLEHEICPNEPCPMTWDGLPIYRDTHHITASFARAMTGALATQIDSVMALQSAPARARVSG